MGNADEARGAGRVLGRHQNKSNCVVWNIRLACTGIDQ